MDNAERASAGQAGAVNTDLSTLPVGVLVVLAVLVVVALTLDVIALIDLYRRPVESVVFGNKWIWLVLILFLNLLGPVLYLVAGRKPARPADTPPATGSRPNGATDVVDKLYGPRNLPDQG